MNLTADTLPLSGITTRAKENETYIAYANRLGTESAFEYCGLSCVTGPDGIDVARAGSNEDMIFADFAKAEFARVRVSLSQLKDRWSDLYF